MKRCARAALLLTAGALGLAAVSPVAAATAAPGVLPVISLAATDADRPEILRATVVSDSAVSSVTVAVPDGDPTADHSWTLSRQTGGDIWVSEPLVLELGVWAGTITATDADGDTATSPVELDYRLVATLDSHSLSSAGLTFSNPTVRASGRITAYDPRTRAAGVVPGGQVWLNMGRSPDATSLEDWKPLGAGGAYAFSTPTPSVVNGESWSVDLQWLPDSATVRPGLPGATGTNPVLLDSTTVTVTTVPSRVVLDATALTVKEPAKAAVKGVVQALVGGVWVGAPGVRLYVSAESGSSAEARSGTAGRFIASIGAWGRDTVTVRIADEFRSPFLRAVDPAVVKDTVTVRVIPRTLIGWNDRTIDATGLLRVNGSIWATNGSWTGKVRIYLQDSTNKTTWRTLGYTTTDVNGYFNAFGYVDHASRYHRLLFKGNTNFQAGSSRAIRLARHEARIVKAKASPSTIRKGRKVKVSGVVQKEIGGKFVNLGKNQVVEYFFRAKGSTKYTYKGYSRTTSTSAFSKTFTVSKDGYWSAVWFTTTSRYVNAYGPDKYVNVTSSASAGEPVPLIGTVADGERLLGAFVPSRPLKAR